jgi:hypothetical protein
VPPSFLLVFYPKKNLRRMLITGIRSKEWQRPQRGIRRRYRSSIQTQTCCVAHIPRDSMTVSSLCNDAVVALHLQLARCIHAPSKGGLLRPVLLRARQLEPTF